MPKYEILFAYGEKLDHFSQIATEESSLTMALVELVDTMGRWPSPQEIRAIFKDGKEVSMPPTQKP